MSAKLCVPTITPFTDDNKVDYNALTNLITSLENAGIEYIFLNGTTGEFSSLNINERKKKY